MRRCFSSLGCPDFSLDATLALAVKHNISAVELRTLGGSVDLAAYFAARFVSPAALAEHVAPTGVEIVALNASLHLGGATEAERAQLVALAPWAEALGVRWLRVFDGVESGSAAGIAEAAGGLAWWNDLRRRHGWKVQLMVETHDALFTGATIARLIAAVPDVAILWDAHHTWRKGGEDPLVTWPSIRDRVVHVHVKDSIPQPSGRHPFTYVLPGDGEFPIAPLLATLRAAAFPGPVSLEWEKMWHPYLDPVDVALATAAARGWW